MSHESPHFEEESGLPEGGVEPLNGSDSGKPQELRGPLAERLALLGLEQMKLLVETVFRPLGIDADAIEAITEEDRAQEFSRLCNRVIFSPSESERASFIEEIKEKFGRS